MPIPSYHFVDVYNINWTLLLLKYQDDPKVATRLGNTASTHANQGVEQTRAQLCDPSVKAGLCANLQKSCRDWGCTLWISDASQAYAYTSKETYAAFCILLIYPRWCNYWFLPKFFMARCQLKPSGMGPYIHTTHYGWRGVVLGYSIVMPFIIHQPLLELCHTRK
jgi:hypothetical protein